MNPLPDDVPATLVPTKKLKSNDGCALVTAASDENAVMAKEDDAAPTCKESDVGITAYMNPDAPGFKGILKHRYTDFLVNEIDMSGQVVHLISLKPPTALHKQEEKTKSTPVCGDAKLIDGLRPLITSDDLEALQKMLNGTLSKTSFKLQPEKEKSTRAKIHGAFNSHMKGVAYTTTVENDRIEVKWGGGERRGRGGNKPQRQQRKTWDELGGRYCHFVLYKENRETVQSLQAIAKAIKVPTKRLTFAGTKDKRGVTSQRVAAEHIYAEQLAGLNKSMKGIQMGNFSYQESGLKLGQLQGNQFEIVLRDLEGTQSDIDKALELLKATGFINYFGMQRFGTQSVSSHKIGLALVKGDWSAAVDLILMPRASDDAEVSKARNVWKEKRDANQALKLFPNWYVAERAVLQYFVDKKNIKDCANALSAVPKNLRTMYVYAYQSYVWNRIVSARLEKLGRHVVPGDLVSTSIANGNQPLSSAMETDEPIDDESLSTPPTPDTDTVQAVTSENASQYSIYDIVAPLPGHSVTYPANMLEEYKRVMAEDGLDPLDMKRNVWDYSLPGSYRNIVGRVKNLEWKFTNYNFADEQLVSTDLDRLRSTSIAAAPKGIKLAVVLKFHLDAATYATMAVREALKSGTTPSYHIGLSAKS
ncbi:hypothetical protein SeMB42_g00594 [Synchytrium endobioticum]|uniref:TRUD domain-containing protein n=1 Tax=Synchytrium endobioticum TaxID=286115 RepID=A0A507DQS8_9FUNG|nr:hypothetical protein SeLEV6574_g01259 [Synchytrium endobioticum]TPX53791.1 hypothetical protein SeMB42_g00594 [Synchytrium endobioticum]